MESECKSALKYLSKAKNTLNETLQIHGAGKMAENEYQFLEKVLASEISKISFLRAFVFIEADKVARAINYLDDTALFSTISRIPETVLTINYLKALLYVFNGIYGRSVEHFEFIQKLAESYGNTTLKFKSTIGQTIILYLTDQKEKALEKVKETVKNLNKDDFDYLLDALIDSGDYFLAMGFPEVSTNLYMKSLELAIDADKVWKSDLILNKMKNSFMASALVGTEKRQTHQIAGLIEEWHELEGVEKYNELMTNFTEFTNKLYEPFEFFTKKEKKHTTYYDLPDEMKHEWKCVKIYENENDSKTLLIGFKEEIGLVGFKVVSGRIFESVPENYTITLKKSAKVEIVPPKQGKIEHLLCRAIVVVPEENRDLKISRKIPVFFEQLRI